MTSDQTTRERGTFALEQHLKQIEHTIVLQRVLHNKLIALGFEWDGQDCYTAPRGWSATMLKDILS